MRNAIRHGAISFAAAIASGAVAYVVRDPETATAAVIAIAFVFGMLTAFAHSEAA